MHTIGSVSAFPIDLPLRERFATSQRQADSSPSVLVKVVASGTIGWGEATPLHYVTGEDQESVIADVAKARDALVGRPIESFRICAARVTKAIPHSSSARCAIESAILDAVARTHDLPLYYYFGGRPMTVETDITIPLVDPRIAAAAGARAAKQGFSKVKIKVGGPNTEEDLERVLAVGDAMRGCSFILDANEGFDPEGAVSFMKSLLGRGVRVDVLEQPVPRDDIEGMKYVKDSISTPVYADEAVQSPQDLLKLIKHDAISGVVIKLMKSGPLAAYDIASIAKAARLELMMGTMLESRVGQSASLHIAAAVGGFNHFDLDSDMLLQDDTITGGFSRSGSLITLLEEPGLGVKVSTPLS